MSRRYTISAVILSKNSEGKIAHTLASLKGWADEIVVVDGLSTDRTVEICKMYGAKVISHEFAGDFGQERNIGIDNSSGDWILQLDTDEIVTEGFKREADRMLSRESDCVAYKFLRKNFFLGHFMKHGGWYHYSLHFFKRGCARYKGRVHHDLIVDGKIGTIEAEIEHYPFDNLREFVERQNRYTSLEAEEIVSLNKHIDERLICYHMRKKPLKLFWKFYVKKKGYKEGTWGFLFSVLFAWVHFLKWSKVWELIRNRGVER